jgi:hypothetical protein
VATYGPLETSDETNTWSLEELEYDDWDYLYFKLSRGSVDPDDTLAYLAPVWFEPNE